MSQSVATRGMCTWDSGEGAEAFHAPFPVELEIAQQVLLYPHTRLTFKRSTLRTCLEPRCVCGQSVRLRMPALALTALLLVCAFQS